MPKKLNREIEEKESHIVLDDPIPEMIRQKILINLHGSLVYATEAQAILDLEKVLEIPILVLRDESGFLAENAHIIELHIPEGKTIEKHKFPQSFQNLVNLKIVVLNKFSFQELPPVLGKLRNLLELDLKNSIFLNFPAEIITWNKLQKLNLRNCNLKTVPTTLGILENLLELDLGENHLTQLPKEIGNLQNLQILNLFKNQLKSLPDSIGNLLACEKLVLTSNDLIKLPESINMLKNLTEIKLLGNHLTSFPDIIITILRQENSKLPASEIEALNIIRINYSKKLERVQKFYVKQSRHHRFQEGYRVNQGHIVGLCIINIDKFPDDIFRLTTLEELILINGQINLLPDRIGNLVGLKVLDISGNKLITLPQTMENLQSLENLSIKSNRFTEIPLVLGTLNLTEFIHEYNSWNQEAQEIFRVEKEKLISKLHEYCINRSRDWHPNRILPEDSL